MFMTTATTVFGMLPLLLIGAEANKRQIWSSLALCTVGGLTTSTLLDPHRHPRPLLTTATASRHGARRRPARRASCSGRNGASPPGAGRGSACSRGAGPSGRHCGRTRCRGSSPRRSACVTG
ncbi:MAG: hypothetical protein MZV63_65005 [Marinilabiliales bacterium]|nr:hypothetical protein [Marinilabiliales bacterium]